MYLLCTFKQCIKLRSNKNCKNDFKYKVLHFEIKLYTVYINYSSFFNTFFCSYSNQFFKTKKTTHKNNFNIKYKKHTTEKKYFFDILLLFINITINFIIFYIIVIFK